MKGKDANMGTTMQNREKMFESLYLHAKLMGEAKINKKSNKKFKI